MNENQKLGAAVVAGYILGRTKKGGTALRFAMFLSGSQQGQQLVSKGRGLASGVLASEEAKQITQQVRGPLQEAIQKAAMAAVQARMVSVTKGLTDRTERLTSAANEVVEGTADTVSDTAEAATSPVKKVTGKLRGRGKGEETPATTEETGPAESEEEQDDYDGYEGPEDDSDEEPEPEPEQPQRRTRRRTTNA
jgi:hypothetical protein